MVLGGEFLRRTAEIFGHCVSDGFHGGGISYPFAWTETAVSTRGVGGQSRQLRSQPEKASHGLFMDLCNVHQYSRKTARAFHLSIIMTLDDQLLASDWSRPGTRM
jgi:hypothetical protein